MTDEGSARSEASSRSGGAGSRKNAAPQSEAKRGLEGEARLARGADASDSSTGACPASSGAGPASPSLSGGEIRTLRKLMQSNERKMGTLQGKIEAVRADMAKADPSDFAALGDFQAQIDDLQSQVDALEEEWLEAAEKLGE